MKNQEMMNILLELKTLVDLQTYLLTKIKSDVDEPEDNIIESDTEKEIQIMKDNIINNDDDIEIKKIHLSKTKDYVKEYNKKRYAEQKNRKVICPYCQLEISYYMKNHHIKQKHKVEHIV
jgi:fructose-specific component phosphotransferase system IIB-like protein